MAFESAIVDTIRGALRAEARRRGVPIKIEKRHGSEFSRVGEPDLFGSVAGRHFEIEVKRPGESPKPIQVQRRKEWEQTGAITGWATTPAEALSILWPDLAPAAPSGPTSQTVSAKSRP